MAINFLQYSRLSLIKKSTQEWFLTVNIFKIIAQSYSLDLDPLKPGYNNTGNCSVCRFSDDKSHSHVTAKDSQEDYL